MLNLMRIEWKKVRLPVLATTILLTVVACVLTSTMYKSYIMYYALDAWERGTEYFTLLFPLFTVVPLCWNLYYERKNNFLLYVLPRVTQKKYLTVKWLVHALCAFFILFLPYLISAIWTLYVNKPLLVENDLFQHVFQHAFTTMPLLYAALLSCWKALIGVLIMTFGFVLSMYVNNIFVILTVPFIYVVLENFILSILRLEAFRLVVAFEPTSISSSVFTIASMIVAPVLLIVVIACTALFLIKCKKATVVKV